jgi:hypothetical protein
MRLITFSLVRIARKNGGDLFEAVLDNDEVWKIYVPQSISRDGGVAKKTVVIKIDE